VRRTRSVWRWQLVLAGTAATVAVFIAALHPHLFTSGWFSAGLIVLAATTLFSLLLPWHRMPAWSASTVPFADILGVALLAVDTTLPLWLLWVFPVAWTATYRSAGWVVASIGLLSMSLLAMLVVDGITPASALQMLIVLLSLGFLSATISIGATRSRAARRLLRRQSEQLERNVQRVAAQERRSVQIIDAMDAGLAGVDSDGNLALTNAAYRELYGHRSGEARQPSSAVEYDEYRGEPLPPSQTSLARAARGEVITRERLWLFDAQGHWRALALTTRRLEKLPGAAPMLIIVEDVTAQLDAEAERRTLAAIVSHELRNPLTAIIGHIELLLDREDLDPAARAQLEVIDNAGQRMRRLVTRSLDAADTASATMEPFDLRRVVQASCDAFAPMADAAGVRVTVHGPPVVELSGDAFRLRQVIDNLLGNAVKYTLRGGQVDILLTPREEGGAQIEIRDTGIGIAPEDLGRVFEPHFRGKSASDAGIPGTGLGLGIAKDIVTVHGGTLDIVSRPGEGTSAVVLLPPLLCTGEEVRDDRR
jgi:two-component system phosphate regulon sensor histidine kinase PhoR